MLDVQVRHPVAPADVTLAKRVAATCTQADGHPPFGDAVWRDLEHPGADSTLVLAFDGDQVVGAVHLGPTDRSGRAVAGIALNPGHRSPDDAMALLQALATDARARGVGRLQLWVFGADEQHDASLSSAGFSRERELWQMRVRLPLDEAANWPERITVRAFDSGRDEDAWLAVNNLAFAGDPDQGGWSLTTLQEREAEPWFDPSGFLLAIDRRGEGEELAGFCWTKLHRAASGDAEAVGEIYVIGVEPDHQGTGLGRALVVAGLASIQARGVHLGMLFVDAANTAAVGLYRALGFDVTRVDRAYVASVA